MSQATERIHELVDKLNQYRNEYYNQDAPNVSDAVYDRLYDELELWEKDTGIILSNSPTQTVGYKAVSSLEKVRHDIPLPWRPAHAEAGWAYREARLRKREARGRLHQARRRGGGELITHNVAAFRNVPLSIPYKGRLAITGEGFIHKSDFERLKGTLTGSDGKPYRNARNLASGSIRYLDAGICREREVSFCAFNVLEGLDEFEDSRDSRSSLLNILAEFGFDTCPAIYIPPDAKADHIASKIQKMTDFAEFKVCCVDFDMPIDGMVLRFNSFSYSATLGRTGHHYNDGIAYKFADDTYETVFRSVEWQTGRFGEIAPVAVFGTVEIDGCGVSRASLHNLSFIKGLELNPDAASWYPSAT